MSPIESARIGVVSDTHGNRDLIALAREILVTREGIDRAYHLGDNYEDAEAMTDWDVPVIVVPGLYCPEYVSGRVPKVHREEIAGRTHVLVHALTSLTAEGLEGAGALFYGHTHHYELGREGALARVNPGHMKASMHKGRPPTCALIEARRDGLDTRIIEVMTGRTVLREIFE